MRDLISKVTFGFLMAQLFPGALLAFALTFLYFSVLPSRYGSVYQAVNTVMATWETGSLGRILVLLGVCTGLGMFIHGLHWAVVGRLESRYGSVFDSYWHDLAIWKQVLLGPVKMIREVGDLLFREGDIRSAGVRENVPRVPADRFAHFQFLQDFYLHSAQFFLHTSYAMLACCGGIIAFSVMGGLTLRRAGIVLLLYVATGLFFVLGRVQLHSLFRAEDELAQHPGP